MSHLLIRLIVPGPQPCEGNFVGEDIIQARQRDLNRSALGRRFDLAGHRQSLHSLPLLRRKRTILRSIRQTVWVKKYTLCFHHVCRVSAK